MRKGRVEKIPIGRADRVGRERYVKRVLSSGVGRVVALEKLGGKVRDALAERGVEVRQFHIPHGESFTPRGEKSLMRAAKGVHEAHQSGIDAAVTCTRGFNRTGRALYLFHRLRGLGHDEAMEESNAPHEDYERLREMWEDIKRRGENEKGRV